MGKKLPTAKGKGETKERPLPEIVVDLMRKKHKVVFVKPPDRFLEEEFVYLQLGPNYLDSYLRERGFAPEHVILYEPKDVRDARTNNQLEEVNLEQLRMLHIDQEGETRDIPFDKAIFANFDIIGASVMSPQAPDAYLLSALWNTEFKHATTVIGGSHPRYYRDQVKALEERLAFDFIVPEDGWKPMWKIASGQIKRNGKAQVEIDNSQLTEGIPAPTRPLGHMKKNLVMD